MKTCRETFKNWYNSKKWGKCSTYEIASMAWHKISDHFSEKETCDTDDEFTWWFDEFDYIDILNNYGVALMAWEEAKKRFEIA
jgi:hypothetical protein